MRLPFAHPGYGEVVRPAGGRLLAALLEVDGASVLYPFVLRPIDGSHLKDITSPYGYGGPLFWGTDDASGLSALFWERFDEWARENDVVSEFIRFSLFDDVLPYPGVTRPRNSNVVSTLPATADELWAGVHKKVRQGVRRAQRIGVETEVDTRCERIDDFIRIYHATMARRESDHWYRFDESFFADLLSALGEAAVIVFALHAGRPVAANLMLLGADTVYAFLGGTDEDAFSLRPTELMEVHSMEWARQQGYARYVLGGGVSPGDGLERYKQRFAPNGGVPFHTGERVLDPDGFDELVRTRRRAFAAVSARWDEASRFFPLYRQPIPDDAPEEVGEPLHAKSATRPVLGSPHRHADDAVVAV